MPRKRTSHSTLSALRPSSTHTLGIGPPQVLDHFVASLPRQNGVAIGERLAPPFVLVPRRYPRVDPVLAAGLDLEEGIVEEHSMVAVHSIFHLEFPVTRVLVLVGARSEGDFALDRQVKVSINVRL